MPSRTVTVGSAVGLHARPAAIVAEAAASLSSAVYLALDGAEPIDASSALMIMTLGAENGSAVEVTGDEQSAVDRIADLIAEDLDEHVTRPLPTGWVARAVDPPRAALVRNPSAGFGEARGHKASPG